MRSRTAMAYLPLLVAPAGLVARCQLRSVVPPLRFLVHGLVGDPAQLLHQRSVGAADRRRQATARRRVHERHELVGEAGHRAADADAAHIRTASDSGHPAALGDVAVHDWAPAADLHEALRRVVVLREVTLLVVAGAVAALVNGLR